MQPREGQSDSSLTQP
nr:unnamed protein product [Callosobruchus chinensis]